MVVIASIYAAGVVVGHLLLARLLKRTRSKCDDTRRVARVSNRFTQRQSTRYLRQIWLWPVYVFLIFPIVYFFKAIWWAIEKAGFGEIYREAGDYINNENY